MDDLAFAIMQLVETGHTVQFSRPVAVVPDIATITLTVHGPLGGGQCTGNDALEVARVAVAHMVEWRLVRDSR